MPSLLQALRRLGREEAMTRRVWILAAIFGLILAGIAIMDWVNRAWFIGLITMATAVVCFRLTRHGLILWQTSRLYRSVKLALRQHAIELYAAGRTQKLVNEAAWYRVEPTKNWGRRLVYIVRVTREDLDEAYDRSGTGVVEAPVTVYAIFLDLSSPVIRLVTSTYLSGRDMGPDSEPVLPRFAQLTSNEIARLIATNAVIADATDLESLSLELASAQVDEDFDTDT